MNLLAVVAEGDVVGAGGEGSLGDFEAELGAGDGERVGLCFLWGLLSGLHSGFCCRGRFGLLVG